MGQTVSIIGTRGYPSYYGGFETLVRRLAPTLADYGWLVSVYGRKSASKVRNADVDKRIKSINSYGLDTKSMSTLTYGFTSVIHAAVTKPDVALIMNVANGYWLPLLRLRSIPTVVNVDGMEWEREKWNRIAKLVFKIGAIFTARFATEIVCDSIEIAARWEKEFKRKSTYIAYGGDSFTVPEAPDGLESRKYVLIVARFVPENTIQQFLDSIPVVAQQAKVVIVGSSGYGGLLDDHVRELARTNNNVLWYGHINDDNLLFSLWAHAGVYFHGHSVGGTNPALVQAMACSAPILARDTVFNREVLGDEGEFVQADASLIAESVLRILRDQALQQRISDSAFARSQNHFTWDRIMSSYNDLCTSLLKSSTRSRNVTSTLAEAGSGTDTKGPE